jgi:SMODS-associated and fused to various effectors sensor domain
VYLRVGAQVEEVLLAMRIRPFLSHKREDQADMSALRGALKVYGAGGYKDVDDLRLGARTADELRTAIHELTGGFIWWGTQKALDSTWINEIEIPNAVARAATKPPYPIVPLFIELSPGGASLRAALRSHADDFLAYNGVVFDDAESPEAFRRRVARRYVRDAVTSLGPGPLAVSFRAISEPDGAHDLTFDWRALIDARRRELTPGALDTMIDALVNVREAAQARTNSPVLRIDPDLPLPLACLVGYEWRITTRAQLEVNQRTGSTFHWISADGSTASIASPIVAEQNGAGPTVIVASCRDGVPGAAARYASNVAAGRLVTLHVDGLLDDDQVRGLARATADELRAANDRGEDKHLLIVGPAALAILIGAAANACGPVVVPFWNGTTYVSAAIIG